MTGATTDDDVIIINDIVKVSCTHTCTCSMLNVSSGCTFSVETLLLYMVNMCICSGVSA